LPRRRPFDLEAYTRAVRGGPCFICALVDGRPGPNRIVYEDEIAVAWLNPWPTLLGYTIVAPRRHVEAVTGDFDEDEYVALQHVVHRVGEAVRRTAPTERLYVLALGTREGNSHVHWHVAPLPPGVPYEEQQLEALSVAVGVLDVSDAELDDLAAALRARLRGDSPTHLP
jgi:diadenosine tetraphosphate (Ap4A) HIT family hydrolase